MAVPKQHRSSSRRDQRRMHIHMKAPQFVVCSNCGKQTLAHKICLNCGYYRGKRVIDMAEKLKAKSEKLKTHG